MTAGNRWSILLLVLFSLTAAAQKNKNQLQAEKQKNLEKIREVEKILTETESQKKNTLGELSASTSIGAVPAGIFSGSALM